MLAVRLLDGVGAVGGLGYECEDAAGWCGMVVFVSIAVLNTRSETDWGKRTSSFSCCGICADNLAGTCTVKAPGTSTNITY